MAQEQGFRQTDPAILTVTPSSLQTLSTLSSHGGVSLPVDHYKYLARATLENGKTMFMEDVWFPLAAPALAAGR